MPHGIESVPLFRHMGSLAAGPHLSDDQCLGTDTAVLGAEAGKDLCFQYM